MPRTDIIEDTLADELLWGVDGKDGMAAFLNIKPLSRLLLNREGRHPG